MAWSCVACGALLTYGLFSASLRINIVIFTYLGLKDSACSAASGDKLVSVFDVQQVEGAPAARAEKDPRGVPKLAVKAARTGEDAGLALMAYACARSVRDQ